MSPEAVMDRGESDTFWPEIERCQHHVSTVQGMDKVGRKPIPILDGTHTGCNLSFPCSSVFKCEIQCQSKVIFTNNLQKLFDN